LYLEKPQKIRRATSRYFNPFGDGVLEVRLAFAVMFFPIVIEFPTGTMKRL